VPRARHRYQTPTAVPTDCDHRGVMPLAEPLSNRLIEVPHQSGLFHKAKVALHEFSQLLAKKCHCLSVAAHIC
jgi:hypothetical protein